MSQCNKVNIWQDWGLAGGANGKEPACQCLRRKRPGFDPWVRKIPWKRAWQPTPVSLPGESHRQRTIGLQRIRHNWSDLAHVCDKTTASLTLNRERLKVFSSNIRDKTRILSLTTLIWHSYCTSYTEQTGKKKK